MTIWDHFFALPIEKNSGQTIDNLSISMDLLPTTHPKQNGAADRNKIKHTTYCTALHTLTYRETGCYE